MPTGFNGPLYIVGPTATGKSQLGIDLARELGGEIINADSRQVYRHMDIGTAKPTPEERRTVPHHLFDLFPPDREFSLGAFLAAARVAIDEIRSRGRLPIVVGGTGQYIWALYEGWNVPEIPPDPAFRRASELEASERGGEVLYKRLKALDPQRASELDPRNVRRVIRALEVHHVTGSIPSNFGKLLEGGCPGPAIGLAMERSRLYQRIDRRVERMMADGFLQEAEQLQAMGYSLGKGPLACPGYRELGQHLQGELSLAEAVQRTKFQTHRLARRQYAWFKLADPRIAWLDGESPDLLEATLNVVSEAS